MSRQALSHLLAPSPARRPTEMHACHRQQDGGRANHLQNGERACEGHPFDHDSEDRIDER